jgi:methionine-rich copper-binding protein CopC
MNMNTYPRQKDEGTRQNGIGCLCACHSAFIPPRVLGALFLSLAICGLASAHAFLDHAEPRVGSNISTSPNGVKIWFTQELEPAFSSIKVFDASGNEVDKKDTRQDDKDKKLLIVSLPALSAGEYKVVWKVVSVDTHRTNGDFKFQIAP